MKFKPGSLRRKLNLEIFMKGNRNNLIPDLYLCVGWRGYGKTYWMYSHTDWSGPVLALDPRGEFSKKSGGKIKNVQSRQDMMELLYQKNFQILYQAGHEKWSVEEDVEFFLTRARACSNTTILIDESSYYFKAIDWPVEFEKMVADSRTANNTIMVSSHRINEIPIKIRGLGRFVVFRVTAPTDLNYLRSMTDEATITKIRLQGFYKYEIVPKN